MCKDWKENYMVLGQFALSRFALCRDSPWIAIRLVSQFALCRDSPCLPEFALYETKLNISI